MSISDRPVDVVRRTTAYRAAVWCTRLEFAWVASWFILPALHAPSVVDSLVWAAGVVQVLSTFALLHLAGVRFGFLTSRPGIADPRMRRQFRRDVFWLPPD